MWLAVLCVVLAFGGFVGVNRSWALWSWGPGAFLQGAAHYVTLPVGLLLLIATLLAGGSLPAWLGGAFAVAANVLMGLGIVWFLKADGLGSSSSANRGLVVSSANVYGSLKAAVHAATAALDAEVDALALLELSAQVAACVDDILVGYRRCVDRPVGGAGIVVWVKGAGPAGKVVDVGGHGSFAGLATVTSGSGLVATVVAAHPTAPKFSAAALGRHNEEMLAISQLVSGLTGPVVLVGDFNASDRAPSMRSLLSATGLIDSHLVAGSGLGHTWGPGGRLFVLRIDHALVSQDLTVRDFYAADVVTSDHRSVTVEVI